MLNISSEKLVEILQSKSKVISTEINQIITDSRKAEPGSLFVAIKGENFDGHQFVKDVFEKGCELAVVSHIIEGLPAEKQIVVDDTVDAFGKIGAYNRSLFKGKVIGLTGSAGKTTTKEEIKFALSVFAKTYATGGNHNNHIGVPQSLLEMDMDAEYAVIEMGMSSKGEISKLVSYVKPDIALVTNVYPMHIEFFENFEGIAEAKAEIFEGLRENGVAIINEDTNFANILEKRASEHGAKVIKFGKNTHYDGVLELEQDGEIQQYNAWAALRVVEALGLDCDKAANALKNFGALDGRGKKHQLKLPNGDVYTLIDDSYSGQPEAMKIAVKSLSKLPCNGRKIAVLGKMAELGDTSKEQHISVGKIVAESNIDIVIGIKPEMKDMLAQLPEHIQQYYFDNKDGLADFLQNKLLQNNDILLIKGARYSSELYKVTDELLKGNR
ncbi:MAG: UDP-N-acetylmuramoyl-tripeptide--D-alanyl-D-alanine ligase [Alphaproteobacteria bacterium]|nr:UDP-N-acetylmuramoyl-tripeptide--D-alanyl-D-alanine ligase [Alphaproteobacteria bacterium]